MVSFLQALSVILKLESTLRWYALPYLCYEASRSCGTVAFEQGDAKVADEKISIKIEPTIPEVVPVISPEPPVVKAAEPVEAPISPTVPPSTSNFDLCPASAAAPTASTGLNSMSPRSITIGGLVITVEVTQLQLCRPTRVILRLPADQSPQDIDTDGPGGGIGVDVFVIFYTNASAPEPSGCLSLTSPECQRRVRQLPLSYSAENDAMIATLFPDPTSMHYSFVVQVCSHVHAAICITVCPLMGSLQASTASSDCLVTPTLIPLGFQDRHPQPEMILLLNHGLGYVCHPVLHLYVFTACLPLALHHIQSM